MRNKKTVLSYLQYHIVFCTRNRRTLFHNELFAKDICILIREKCIELDIKVLNLQTGASHIEIVVECPPDISPAQVVHRIKRYCSIEAIKEKYERLEPMHHLWSRGFLVSTNMLDQKTITEYVLSIKSRYD